MTRRTVVIVAVVAVAFAVVLLAQAASIRLPGNDQGYEPAQPIAYSHRLHAGELEIPCLYCHSGAERSRHAGVSSAKVCMNCHRMIKATAAQRHEAERAAKRAGRQFEPDRVMSAEIRKIYDALALRPDGRPNPAKTPKPIRWIQVHANPDFVAFDHRRHVAAKVQCQTCHGPVQSMERISQFSDLRMGWCVSCHRRANAKARAARDPHRASTDCAACHY